jgi:hypothetical protein
MTKHLSHYFISLGIFLYTSLSFVLNSIAQDNIDTIAENKLSTNNTTSDTTQNNLSLEEKWGIKISKDALPHKIISFAKDSVLIDAKAKIIYLHGDSKIEYDNLKLSSGHTKFDNNIKEVTAYPQFDTAGKRISLQEFEQGEEKFQYDTLRYNFDSKRALVRNARMQYGEGFILSQQIKRNADESIFGWKNVYTTCNIPDHPHFGIRANRIKVIPNRMVASGPANFELQQIPTPLFLPFGIFPSNSKQKSGFILPTYTMEANRGLGLQRGGYFLMINPHVNTLITLDIFSGGSWGLFTSSQYAKRYQYTGNFNINYSKSLWGEPFELSYRESKDFKVQWNHQMDSRARPGTNFSAQVDVGTSNYNLMNGMNANVTLNNQYSSSISYSKTWIGKPYSFSAALRHGQNTLNRSVSVTLPELNFNLGQLTPFQSNNNVGKPKWYEKLTLSYNISAVNKLDFYDSLLNQIITDEYYKYMNNGIRQNINARADYNIFRYFTLNFSVPYTEYWNTKQQFINYDAPTRDTTINLGFYTTREFSIDANLNTRIYGMFNFKRGPIKAMRHVLMPTIGVSYKPNFARDPFNYMYTTTDTLGRISYYSPYTGSPIGGPNNYVERGEIVFGINNTLQAKRRVTDTLNVADKGIINLIDGFAINGRYNVIADTNKLSDIAMSFRTTLFKKLNISAGANYTPYKYEGSRRSRHYLWDTDKKVAQLINANLNMGISFDATNKERGTDKDTTDLGNDEDNETYRRLMQNGRYDEYYDFNIPWNLSINGGIRVVRRYSDNKADSFIYTPNMTFSGGFNLTERWKFNVTSGVDFSNMKRITLGYTQLNIVRDLHCWQMSLNMVPFGQLRSFYFTLQVKAAVLQDLKLTRRRSFQDNY